MAEYKYKYQNNKYKYQNNVQLMNNITTNNFTVGISNIVSATFETINKEEVASLLDEQTNLIDAIELVCMDNIDEKNICNLMAKIIDVLDKTTAKNLTSLSIGINSLTSQDFSLLNNYYFNRA